MHVFCVCSPRDILRPWFVLGTQELTIVKKKGKIYVNPVKVTKKMLQQISMRSTRLTSTNKDLKHKPNFQLCTRVIFVWAFSALLFFPDKAEFTSELRPRGHLCTAFNGEADKAFSWDPRLIISKGAEVLRIIFNLRY